MTLTSALNLIAQVSRGYRLRHLLSHRWFLLPSLHQPRHRYPSGIHAHRQLAGQRQAPKANTHSGTLFILEWEKSESTLTLFTVLQIAKMLQNLANKPSYAKEAYMMSLNPFVDNNKTRMNLFLNSLCDVGDFYDTLEVGFKWTAARRESQAD